MDFLHEGVAARPNHGGLKHIELYVGYFEELACVGNIPANVCHRIAW